MTGSGRVRLVFADGAGDQRTIEHLPGSSVMEAAVEHEIAGIEAQCYGAGVCGTCHLYVEAGRFADTGERSAWEDDMLDALTLSRPNSRLSCQIKVSPAIDGVVFTLPERQEALT
jgi:2Fe-2S ferredoxin